MYIAGVDGNKRDKSHRQMLNAFRIMASGNVRETERATILLRATQELTRM